MLDACVFQRILGEPPDDARRSTELQQAYDDDNRLSWQEQQLKIDGKHIFLGWLADASGIIGPHAVCYACDYSQGAEGAGGAAARGGGNSVPR
jgi:hypothetical protein